MNRAFLLVLLFFSPTSTHESPNLFLGIAYGLYQAMGSKMMLHRRTYKFQAFMKDFNRNPSAEHVVSFGTPDFVTKYRYNMLAVIKSMLLKQEMITATAEKYQEQLYETKVKYDTLKKKYRKILIELKRQEMEKDDG